MIEIFFSPSIFAQHDITICRLPENLVRHLHGIDMQVEPNHHESEPGCALYIPSPNSPDTRCGVEFRCSVILPRPATLKNARPLIVLIPLRPENQRHPSFFS